MNEKSFAARLARLPIALVGGLLFGVVSPNVDLFPELTWHDGQRIQQCMVLVGILLLGLAGFTIVRKVIAWPRWIVMAWVLFFVLGGISAATSTYPSWALLEVGWLLALVILCWRIACDLTALETVMKARWIVGAFAISATAFVAKSGVVYFGMMTTGRALGQPFDVMYLLAGFSNPRFFGQWATMLLPMLLLLGDFPNRSLRWRAVAFLLPSLFWALVIASYTRGSFAGLLFGFFAASLLGGRYVRGFILRGGLTALAGCAIYVIFFLILPVLLTHEVWTVQRNDVLTLTGRDILWSFALESINRHPWLGIGPMHFAISQNHGTYLPTIGATHPHNAVLQIATEWGIPAVLITMLLIAWLIKVGWVNCRACLSGNPGSLQTNTYLALTAALAGAAAQSMVDGVLVMPVSQMTLVLLVAWATTGMAHARKDVNLIECGSIAMRFLPVIHGVALLAVIIGVAPDILSPNDRIDRYQSAYPGVRLWPRFWAQGWIDQ